MYRLHLNFPKITRSLSFSLQRKWKEHGMRENNSPAHAIFGTRDYTARDFSRFTRVRGSRLRCHPVKIVT